MPPLARIPAANSRQKASCNAPVRASAAFSAGPSVRVRTTRTSRTASGMTAHGSNSQALIDPKTHGSGAVMSPVTQKSTEGLPNFYLKDIPPAASDGAPAVTEPRIYFGQSTNGYVIVKGSTPEFDYPKGSDNVYANYDGVLPLTIT